MPEFERFTWFELTEYAYGVQEAEWEQASYLATFIVNTHVTKKAHCKKWDALNPFLQARKNNKKATEQELLEFKKLLEE